MTTSPNHSLRCELPAVFAQPCVKPSTGAEAIVRISNIEADYLRASIAARPENKTHTAAMF